MDRGGWQATVYVVARVGYNLVTKLPPHFFKRKTDKEQVSILE